ncbi:hypothetical protein DYB25_002252 [Aphanomyces astaci]|uniref:Uncharacterized protein n=1 Tax=Aphanomyces astaci TaxID=112090 RepID=A0A397FDT0_APHAT|nr:hypothetical protein DYB25_002252 [Aphanomyces astaci]RHY22596.1 hypothetical protein DYB36_011690 [Aphanomyces astaci]RHY43853.1 hypothetical protein DYB34_011501 [Aphanomyces astaci]RHY53515.1 hypothetical protein DYB30_005513 [Aphanomyces astaci]RHZ16856.1 hypothetical protein DYB31_009075 [Aphanomyces astaci]
MLSLHAPCIPCCYQDSPSESTGAAYTEARQMLGDTPTLPRLTATDCDGAELCHASNVQKHSAAYRAKHRDILREKNRQWKLANKERVAAQKAAYREKHREKIRAHDRAIYRTKTQATQQVAPSSSTLFEPPRSNVAMMGNGGGTSPRLFTELLYPCLQLPHPPTSSTISPLDEHFHPSTNGSTPLIPPMLTEARVAPPLSHRLVVVAEKVAGSQRNAVDVASVTTYPLQPMVPCSSNKEEVVVRSRPLEREPSLKQQQQRRNRNLTKQLEYDRTYRRRHQAKLALKSRQYYLTSKDKVIEYKAAHRDQVLAASREWKARNKERVQAQRKAYRERNLDRIREHDRAMYRAKKAQRASGVGVELSTESVVVL